MHSNGYRIDGCLILPASESDYAYQWVRVDSGVDTDVTGATRTLR